MSAIGLVNATLVLRPFSRDPVAEVPISVLIAPAQADTAPGLRAYVSFVKSQAAPIDAGRMNASIMFVSYLLITTRALGAHCEREGADIGSAKALIANLHQNEYAHASSFLASHGVNSDILWHLLQSDLSSLADLHLSRDATYFDLDRRRACQRIADDPEAFAARRLFRTGYPELYRQLMVK